MKTDKGGPSPKARLEIGAAVLASAKLTDVTVIKPRVIAFTNAHRDYEAIHGTVEAAWTAWRKGQTQLRACKTEQDDKVEEVACTLVTDGEPRGNPFEAFNTGTPSAIKQLPTAEQAKTIRALVEAVQESKTASTATRRAARAAAQAVEAVAAAQVNLRALATALRMARDTRTAVGKKWDNALAALKRAARAAADDGAPGLYEALLGGVRRPKTKKAKAAPVGKPAANPVTPAPAEPAPVATTPPAPPVPSA